MCKDNTELNWEDAISKMEEDSPKQRMKDSHKCVENIEDIPTVEIFR
jgi:hypothetical protein